MILVATQGTDVREAHQYTNFNSSSSALVTNQSGNNMRAYMKFDISSLPATINNAFFWFYVNMKNGTATRTHEVRRTTSAWTDSTITWYAQPTVTNTNMASQSIPPSTGWYYWNIKNLLNDEAGSTLGLQIKDSAEDLGDDLIIYYSSDTYSDPVFRPRIIINDYYVKPNGNDVLSGMSWDNAWKTINKAATTVPDGSSVHVGFGTFYDEPAANKIAPQNVGTIGIDYMPQTDGTHGGTGTVSIEQNP